MRAQQIDRNAEDERCISPRLRVCYNNEEEPSLEMAEQQPKKKKAGPTVSVLPKNIYNLIM